MSVAIMDSSSTGDFQLVNDEQHMLNHQSLSLGEVAKPVFALLMTAAVLTFTTGEEIAYIPKNFSTYSYAVDDVVLSAGNKVSDVDNTTVEPKTETDISNKISSITTEQKIKDFHDKSQLTWSQISRLFAVSRRSVHLWAAGESMDAGHEERLNNLIEDFNSFASQDYISMKSALLDSSKGMSLFQKWLNEVQLPDIVNRQPLSPRQLIEA
ncbi:hypothetical protein OZX57_01770 [Bifidobacterium sp. ESL0682]|uniref:hypothetical protein n=1 Tax=Bifidobacterium sp. ESL0682 TaxID=2983212 RepID=UPI0023F7397A|nr:hypothetical protein [Bifidobacterium sp. ESL0682]WEV42244.1 hypothetical protein OZX57_01770 [Bifidobacterium sp. ESL0682]